MVRLWVFFTRSTDHSCFFLAVSYWCTHFRLKMALCDKCKLIKQDVECRPSDEILCGSCHQDNLIKWIRAMAGIKESIETRTAMREGTKLTT